jgi:hypothetical protein
LQQRRISGLVREIDQCHRVARNKNGFGFLRPNNVKTFVGFFVG